jgi:hypothetical protein
LHREGKEFAPTAGMILKRTVELQLDPPDWADAARELGKCLAYGERVYRQGEFHDDRAGRLEQAPLSVREFVRSVGWRQIEGWESDTAAEAQLRNKWSAFVARGRLRTARCWGWRPLGRGGWSGSTARGIWARR